MTASIKSELSSRKMEIEQFIDILQGFENGTYIISSGSNQINYPTTVKTTQKSCVILLLYNAIESTMTQLLKHLHNSIIIESTSFFDLNDELREMTVVYINSIMEKKNNKEAAPHIIKFMDFALDKKKYTISYDEMSDYYSLYSGNLDSKEIKSILKKYGICFENPTSELKTIKEGRNNLAHGDVSFAEYGRDLTSQKIDALFKIVFDYLDKLIDKVDVFVNEKSFKRTF